MQRLIRNRRNIQWQFLSIYFMAHRECPPRLDPPPILTVFTSAEQVNEEPTKKVKFKIYQICSNLVKSGQILWNFVKFCQFSQIFLFQKKSLFLGEKSCSVLYEVHINATKFTKKFQEMAFFQPKFWYFFAKSSFRST